jgi:hypothetical protein
MNDNFIFSVMSAHHKKLYVIHKLIVFALIITAIISAIKITNPSIYSDSDRVSLAIGVFVGLLVGVSAMLNRIKTLFKVKFVAFLIIWILLLCFNMILDTLIWSIGLVLIPLSIDDLIFLPFWKNVWYNDYER